MSYSELYHHGIKGQRWGIRRFQNEDGTYTAEGKMRRKEVTNYGREGGTIKKGSTLYRVSLNKKDPTFGKRKYVSTSDYDNALWEDNLIGGYRKKYPNLNMYAIKYKTVKDIKVAPEIEIGKRTLNILKKDPTIANRSVNELIQKNPTNMKKIDWSDPGMFGGLNIKNETKLGEIIVKDLLDSGYDAVGDSLGYNVAHDPVIVLNPDKKMKRISSNKYE